MGTGHLREEGEEVEEEEELIADWLQLLLPWR